MTQARLQLEYTHISTSGWKVAAASPSVANSEIPSSSNVGTEESSCKRRGGGDNGTKLSEQAKTSKNLCAYSCDTSFRMSSRLGLYTNSGMSSSKFNCKVVQFIAPRADYPAPPPSTSLPEAEAHNTRKAYCTVLSHSHS